MTSLSWETLHPTWQTSRTRGKDSTKHGMAAMNSAIGIFNYPASTLPGCVKQEYTLSKVGADVQALFVGCDERLSSRRRRTRVQTLQRLFVESIAVQLRACSVLAWMYRSHWQYLSKYSSLYRLGLLASSSCPALGPSTPKLSTLQITCVTNSPLLPTISPPIRLLDLWLT